MIWFVVKKIALSFFDSYLKKSELKDAIHQNKIRLASDEKSYNHAYEMAALTGADVWLKRFSFIIIFFPLVLIYFDKQAVTNYFFVVSGLPDSYLYLVGIVIGALWGVSELKNYKGGRNG